MGIKISTVPSQCLFWPIISPFPSCFVGKIFTMDKIRRAIMALLLSIHEQMSIKMVFRPIGCGELSEPKAGIQRLPFR